MLDTDLPDSLELWTKDWPLLDRHDQQSVFVRLDEVWSAFVRQSDRFDTVVGHLWTTDRVTDLPLLSRFAHVSRRRI